ncbi:MAG: energy-coupling factor transporter transmembrane component T [Tissierellia bacterium]|nr:energy-coupling factor transporter transmembrane component T [Tissierellia bacterium]
MTFFGNNKLNPCPISKLVITIFLSFTITKQAGDLFNLGIVFVFAILFFVNGKKSLSVKLILFYIFTLAFIGKYSIKSSNLIVNMISMVFILSKIFFLPIMSGIFLISTSDVSSMIVSMEKLKIPKNLHITIAVMFRYFPAFQDDKRNIKMAMQMRNISFKNPFKYMEYIAVPILISAINIADDISKAAETKCISDPCEKIRYIEIKFKSIDFIFIFSILGIYLAGLVFST